MSRILVSGLINIETTAKVNGFPIEYAPVHYPFFGLKTTVSGVGYNVAKALRILGNDIEFLSIIGDDNLSNMVYEELRQINVSDKYIKRLLPETAQSVIIYDNTGRRQINVDLKNLQETEYPENEFSEAIEKCEIAVMCNINFSRKYLSEVKNKGKIIATDVHVLHDIYDEYNKEFIRNSNILFLSNEAIKGREEDFVRSIYNEYHNDIIVVGMGQEGAMMHLSGQEGVIRLPAVKTREIINTIGAGDALFSAFIHNFAETKDPIISLKKAIVFASYKIGEKGAACGFLNDEELENWYRKF